MADSTEQESPSSQAPPPRFQLALRTLVFLETGLKWIVGAWVIIEVTHALAGEKTVVDFTAWLAYSTGDKPWELIAYAVLILWGFGERFLRQQKTSQMSERIQNLEQQIDPNRKSSQLTPKGQTHPFDRGL